MCKNVPTPAGVCVRFKRSDNQSGLKGRQTDYLMITFSSIKASMRVERVLRGAW
ncbi:hypothetical protein GLGR_0154 [Leminorella grimontii ATCC 33999 = DSM 5078]|nr:hypothetical protein GLGR_0154 [Leminorella grimontii ATCC 33999 = DSM 5078]